MDEEKMAPHQSLLTTCMAVKEEGEFGQPPCISNLAASDNFPTRWHAFSSSAKGTKQPWATFAWHAVCTERDMAKPTPLKGQQRRHQ